LCYTITTDRGGRQDIGRTFYRGGEEGGGTSVLVAVLVVLALIKILLKIHDHFYSNICSNHTWHYGCQDKASVATNYAIMVAKVPRYRQTTMINILLLLLYFGITFISFCIVKVKY